MYDEGYDGDASLSLEELPAAATNRWSMAAAWSSTEDMAELNPPPPQELLEINAPLSMA